MLNSTVQSDLKVPQYAKYTSEYNLRQLLNTHQRQYRKKVYAVQCLFHLVLLKGHGWPIRCSLFGIYSEAMLYKRLSETIHWNRHNLSTSNAISRIYVILEDIILLLPWNYFLLRSTNFIINSNQCDPIAALYYSSEYKKNTKFLNKKHVYPFWELHHFVFKSYLCNVTFLKWDIYKRKPIIWMNGYDMFQSYWPSSASPSLSDSHFPSSVREISRSPGIGTSFPSESTPTGSIMLSLQNKWGVKNMNNYEY